MSLLRLLSKSFRELFWEIKKTLNWLFYGGDFCIFVFNNNWGINRVWLCAHVAIFMQYHWIKSVCHCSSNFRALTSPRAYSDHWQMTWMMPGWGHYRMENLDNMMKKARSIDEGGRWRHHAPVPMVGRSWLRSGAQVCWYYIQTDALHAHRALYRHCTDTVHCQGSSITPWLSCPGQHQATSVLVRTSKTLGFKENMNEVVIKGPGGDNPQNTHFPWYIPTHVKGLSTSLLNKFYMPIFWFQLWPYAWVYTCTPGVQWGE